LRVSEVVRFVRVDFRMRTPRTIILLATAAGLGLLPCTAAASRWETLQAIHLVENPTDRTGYGPRGELGAYQFRADTWRLHTKKPFRMALDRATSDEVAVAHYEWIKRGLIGAGIDANTYNIALAWNCGLGAVVSGRVPAVTYRYASQVKNLADMLAQRSREEKAAARTLVASAQPEQPDGDLVVPAVPAFNLTVAPLKFEVAGQEPRFVVRSGEPEITATVRTVKEAPAENTVQIAATAAPTKSPAPRFVIATLD
jgi:hypothetical protein